MPDQDHQNQKEAGFYRDASGGLLLIDRNGKSVKLDFDVDKLNLKKNEESTIKNNIEKESDMENLEKTSQTEDLTPQQAEENYWVETPKTKIDGSTAMMEARISAMMQSTGKSREESSKEVKARMKKAGSDNTNTTDTSDVKDEEVKEEEDEEDEEDKKDTIEICSKEFDMLKAKAERLDTLEAEKEELQHKMDTIESKVNTIFEERAKEVENRRLETIKKFSTDFDVPEEKLKDKTIERLEEDMALLNMAIKKNVVEEEPIAIDFNDVETDFGKRIKALDDAYKIKVVK